MPRRLRRKTHSSHEHKCPHCIEPEKWCKNLSGLTQHINSVHLELFQRRASSPVEAAPRSPDVQNPRLSSSPILPAFNDDDDDDVPPLLEEPDPDIDSLDAPGHTEFHPTLRGMCSDLVLSSPQVYPMHQAFPAMPTEPIYHLKHLHLYELMPQPTTGVRTPTDWSSSSPSFYSNELRCPSQASPR